MQKTLLKQEIKEYLDYIDSVLQDMQNQITTHLKAIKALRHHKDMLFKIKKKLMSK